MVVACLSWWPVCQGSGKSAVAEGLARELSCAVLPTAWLRNRSSRCLRLNSWRWDTMRRG